MGNPRARYTQEFMIEAVRMVRGGQSMAAVAKILSISPKTAGGEDDARRIGRFLELRCHALEEGEQRIVGIEGVGSGRLRLIVERGGSDIHDGRPVALDEGGKLRRLRGARRRRQLRLRWEGLFRLRSWLFSSHWGNARWSCREAQARNPREHRDWHRDAQQKTGKTLAQHDTPPEAAVAPDERACKMRPVNLYFR